jgi:DNA-binding NtrC family response regulator
MLSSSHTATSPSTTQAPDCSSRCVLLVDDEITVRSALRRYFIRRGWRVCEAEDGEQARALLLDGAVIGGGFDAVITDMRMPRLSGVALHDLVSRTCATLGRRFVFSSGDMGDDAAIAYLSGTHCPVMMKPFELAALLAAVERVANASTVPAG